LPGRGWGARHSVSGNFGDGAAAPDACATLDGVSPLSSLSQFVDTSRKLRSVLLTFIGDIFRKYFNALVVLRAFGIESPSRESVRWNQYGINLGFKWAVATIVNKGNSSGGLRPA